MLLQLLKNIVLGSLVMVFANGGMAIADYTPSSPDVNRKPSCTRKNQKECSGASTRSGNICGNRVPSYPLTLVTTNANVARRSTEDLQFIWIPQEFFEDNPTEFTLYEVEENEQRQVIKHHEIYNESTEEERKNLLQLEDINLEFRSIVLPDSVELTNDRYYWEIKLRCNTNEPSRDLVRGAYLDIVDAEEENTSSQLLRELLSANNAEQSNEQLLILLKTMMEEDNAALDKTDEEAKNHIDNLEKIIGNLQSE